MQYGTNRDDETYQTTTCKIKPTWDSDLKSMLTKYFVGCEVRDKLVNVREFHMNFYIVVH